MHKIYGLLLLCTFSLTACLSPIKKIDKSTYTFSPSIAEPQHASVIQKTLLINIPTTSAAYNTTQMVYSQQPYQLNYFAKNSWVDSPPQMLQPLLVQTLQHSFHAVCAIVEKRLGQDQSKSCRSVG